MKEKQFRWCKHVFNTIRSGQPPFRELQNGSEDGKPLKDKEYRTRKRKTEKHLIDWGHIVLLVWGEKAESWIDIWGSAAWKYCCFCSSGEFTGTQTLFKCWFADVVLG